MLYSIRNLKLVPPAWFDVFDSIEYRRAEYIHTYKGQIALGLLGLFNESRLRVIIPLYNAKPAKLPYGIRTNKDI